MQIRSFRESVTKARGPPAPKLLSKTAGCTAGKIVGAPRRAGPQGHRSVSGEFALSRGVSHPISDKYYYKVDAERVVAQGLPYYYAQRTPQLRRALLFSPALRVRSSASG